MQVDEKLHVISLKLFNKPQNLCSFKNNAHVTFSSNSKLAFFSLYSILMIVKFNSILFNPVYLKYRFDILINEKKLLVRYFVFIPLCISHSQHISIQNSHSSMCSGHMCLPATASNCAVFKRSVIFN